MALSIRSYSRLIAWLKVILPLAAIGLLSTLFLLSRSSDPLSNLPFSEIDLQEIASSQRITRPSFAGATAEGDLIAFTADSAEPKGDGMLNATTLAAQIDLITGQSIGFTAGTGVVNRGTDTALLQDDVVITSSLGYRISTDALETGMEVIRAETLGPVDAVGPPGTFSAGHMQLTTDPDTGDAYFVFTDGVDLVYDPKKPQE